MAAQSLQAQPVIPDNSTRTQIGGSVDCSADCIITGGEQAGTNLFHSFENFSILDAVTITFDANSVDRVLTRVTGGQASDIRGRLAVMGDADFFLLNPNGIVFHDTSALQLQGSFVASTATSLQFADGVLFTAATPVNAPLLTISAPIGLQFGDNPGRIETRGALLPGPPPLIAPGQTFALLGGDVAILGSNLFAPDGNLVIQSAAANDVTSLLTSAQGYELGENEVAQGGRLTIQQSSLQTTGLDGGGKIQLRGQNIDVAAAGIINRSSPFATQDSQGIVLEARDRLRVEGGTEILTETTGLNQGGSIELLANEIAIAGNVNPTAPAPTLIAAETSAPGLGGEILLQGNQIEILDFSLVGTETTGPGHAGNVRIEAGQFLLSGARVVSRTEAGGDAGRLELTVAEQAELRGVVPFVGLAAGFATETLGEGPPGTLSGGEISIAIGPNDSGMSQLRVQDGAQVSASTFGSGKSADVTVRADEILLSGSFVLPSDGSLIRSGIFSQVEGAASGEGGNIQIFTHALTLQERAQVTSSTLAQGDAGKIEVLASESISIDSLEAGIFAQVEPDATGSGGNIDLKTAHLSLQNDGRISATTAGLGRGGTLLLNLGQLSVQSGSQIQVATLGTAAAGNLEIQATGSVQLEGVSAVNQAPSGLLSSTGLSQFQFGDQSAGDIQLQAQNLTLSNGARISASSFNAGAGGRIDLAIAEKILVQGLADEDQTSGLFAVATALGKAGDIQISANTLQLEQQAAILAETVSNDGGNIALSLDENLFLRQGSLISTTAGLESGLGDGGNITIQTPFLITTPLEDSDIIANAFQGNGGQIQIATQLLLGIKPRPATPNNGTNDIDASSEAGTDGTVEIDNFIDQNSILLITLADEPTDTSQLIGSACSAPQKFPGQFVVTGRGGLPQVPGQSDGFWTPLLARESRSEQQVNRKTQSTPNVSTKRKLEAQGWSTTVGGKIQLLASHHGTSYRPDEQTYNC